MKNENTVNFYDCSQGTIGKEVDNTFFFGMFGHKYSEISKSDGHPECKVIEDIRGNSGRRQLFIEFEDGSRKRYFEFDKVFYTEIELDEVIQNDSDKMSKYLGGFSAYKGLV